MHGESERFDMRWVGNIGEGCGRNKASMGKSRSNMETIERGVGSRKGSMEASKTGVGYGKKGWKTSNGSMEAS